MVAGLGSPDLNKEPFETMANTIDINRILAFEQGELDEDEVIDLFQDLVNSGLAWQLQGHYGRTARDLIEAGYITPPEVSHVRR